LTLSIENLVSKIPDVKTRQRRMSYTTAMHQNKHNVLLCIYNTQTHTTNHFPVIIQ